MMNIQISNGDTIHPSERLMTPAMSRIMAGMVRLLIS